MKPTVYFDTTIPSYFFDELVACRAAAWCHQRLHLHLVSADLFNKVLLRQNAGEDRVFVRFVAILIR
jgi:hypothetical protein